MAAMLCLFALDLRKIKPRGLCKAVSQWAAAALWKVIDNLSTIERPFYIALSLTRQGHRRRVQANPTSRSQKQLTKSHLRPDLTESHSVHV